MIPWLSCTSSWQRTTNCSRLDSFVTAPVNLALTVTETVLNKYLLPADDEIREGSSPKAKKEKPRELGPIFRTTKLSKRLQKQALSKMKNLSLRSADQVANMTYCVDLIKYAANNLDAAVKTTVKTSKQMVAGTIDKTLQVSAAGIQAAKQTGEKSVLLASEFTQNTITALLVSIEEISKQIAQPFASGYSALRDRTPNLNGRALSVTNIKETAQQKINQLRQIAENLSKKITSGETIPQQYLRKVAQKLTNIIEEILIPLYNHPHKVILEKE